jgi:uncharacterized repeat protein (TIGR03803 family)
MARKTLTQNGPACGEQITLAVPCLGAPPTRATTLTTFYNFNYQKVPPDGFSATGALIMDAQGVLYGTTAEGGTNDGGTVFKLTPPAPGKTAWTEKVLHNFGPCCSTPGDGSFPQSTLVMDAAGALYGTTLYGGANGTGSVFKLTPPAPGKTKWTETILHSFSALNSDGSNTDGANPYAGALVFDSQGNLFGTTYSGGLGGGDCGNGTRSCLRAWYSSYLHPRRAKQLGQRPYCTISRKAAAKSISGIYAGLTIDANGALYGASVQGGTGGTGISYGSGAAFMLTPPGGGQTSWGFQVLYIFAPAPVSNDGKEPEVAPIIDATGSLYGTTARGGLHDGGTVYRLTPPAAGSTAWTETILYNIPSGGYPFLQGVAFDASGALYGTTLLGGSAQLGNAYKLTPPAGGVGRWKSTNLITFRGPNGEQPDATLMAGPDGAMYGTTSSGGRHGFGTIFRITP